MRHDDGWETQYLHMTNDTPGTDNGKGWGIAPGIVPGARVEAGRLLGWVGDSGNAEKTPPHLHFELIDPDGVHANSFESLLLAGGNPPPPSWSAGDRALLASSPLLRRGDTGAAVGRLQEILDGLGYHVGGIDGLFGVMTAAAVMEFQADFGLAVDGLVGPQTRGVVGDVVSSSDRVLGLGSRGAAVREAQELLGELGFAPGPIDGIFGPRTLGAVLALQRDLGLQVDGLVGSQTRSGLGMR